MPKPAMAQEPAATVAADRAWSQSASGQRLHAYLVTTDDSLWSALGTLGKAWTAKQVDSVDELIATTPPGQAAVVLLDVRGENAVPASLSRIQLHSTLFAVVALDLAGNVPAWSSPTARGQVAGCLPLPPVSADLAAALGRAREEISARTALLAGERTLTGRSRPDYRRFVWAAVLTIILVLIAGAWLLWRHTHVPAISQSIPATVSGAPASAIPTAVVDEKVDVLIERAQQAMLERHYLDPADGSALALYRAALVLDPANGEAAQGMQRLAEILFSKVQSSLDDRMFDVALQALETARSISPSDHRLAALDERIATLRAELGPAQIQAAVNAQNFDRAMQLIDEAVRAKTLGGAKLGQLKEEVRRRREQVDVNRLVSLIEARLQQERLIDPRNDSAAYYLAAARQAGATAATLQGPYQEFFRRCVQAARTAIEQRHLAEAERLANELRSTGAPGAVVAALQRDLAAARAQPAREKIEQPQFLDLARTRLAQGSIIEPENDSALYYLNQARAAAPQTIGLPQISSAIQTQILDRVRAALEARDPSRAETLLRLATGLGATAETDALNERLLQTKLASAATNANGGGAPAEVPENTLTRIKPLQPQYPNQALARNLEGWVELGYTVNAKGYVTDVKVLQASSPGVFDGAAVSAVSHIRYKPPTQAGKPMSASTKIRVAFHIAPQ